MIRCLVAVICEVPGLPAFWLSRAAMALLHLIFCSLVAAVGLTTLQKFHSVGIFRHTHAGEVAVCRGLHAIQAGYDGRIEADLAQVAALQERLVATIQRIDKSRELRSQSVPGSEFRRFLEEEVIHPLGSAHARLQLIRHGVPRVEEDSRAMKDPLVEFFAAEEARRYLTGKENRRGELSVHGASRTRATIGHACVLMKEELEEYMSYDVGAYCEDDWLLGQRLMVGGCDPLPRRRCLARAPPDFRQLQLLGRYSLWRTPKQRDARWEGQRCGNVSCISSSSSEDFSSSGCTACFELEKERLRWAAGNDSRAQPTDFLVEDVLSVKPGGEIRIDLDVSVRTGVCAARMQELGITVVSTTFDAGAPYSEAIAIRGLVPLHATVNQRLPFFDNTMDLIHTAGVLDGWVDLQLMDFVLFDWDRVLRLGGLLWIDGFVCERKYLDDYSYMFQQFRYRKHRWAVSPKSGDDVYLSALLEKPSRSL
ncbi:hypothetical protein Taro_009341 [Colocasia esculenta]|uniref:Methyltransferase type 11 domain-containing protein n=1 Tax=Colocasia esculenta TaxID=4460 RepID=A0A843U4L7_COLES|nr:hypothetical protein [Colocasia esculenta]